MDTNEHKKNRFAYPQNQAGFLKQQNYATDAGDTSQDNKIMVA